ncbi:PadR family transcriptional regulator [Actinocorallia sp. A-T 12471]|uniref:PadR family transcriptional regulator n=1 Tax=Actinocorallia sp. A-T 12471 TaxID=3089813 RepID=UPI0029CEB99C|nr:PadR family transcriptional regulator [Actinocorallia sp. A-T 12471]MDX6739139.1 PadR family transcriptional regulator [Actinocorallia sp. A-T 12471]
MDNGKTLLGLLSQGPSHGYDLKHTFDRFFGGEKPLAFGQVYAVLARMLRDGLIAYVGEEATGEAPDRKKYMVTPIGREMLLGWMFTAEPPSPASRSDLMAKTVIALLVDEDAQRLLDVQRSAHLARMRDLTKARRDAALLDVLAYDHALFHIEADLRWIDLAAARLDALRQEIAQR